MKKNLRNILTTAGVLLSVSAPVCSAQQATSPAPESLMPKTVDLVFRLDTTVKNPIVIFTDFLTESLKDSLPGNEDGANLIKSFISGNVITLGVDFPPADKQEAEPDFYVFTKIDATNLDRLLKMNGTEPVKSNYSGVDTYTQESAYIGYTNGNILITNKEDTLKTTIDRMVKPDGNALSEDDNYVKAASHLIKDSFLDFYQAPGAFTSPVTEEISPMFGTFMNDIMKAQQAGSGSLAQTDKGFEYTFYAKSDKDSLNKLGINLNDFNFVPGLYKRISGSGLLFYTENNNLNSALKNAEKMIETSAADEETSWKTGFKDETGIDFDSAVLDNLEGRYAFAITATDQIYPAFTMMFEAKSEIKTVLAKFAEYINKKLRAETPGDSNDYYTYEIKNIGGTYFYSFRIDLSRLDQSMSELPEASRILHLNMSVTEGNVLLISTHPDLEEFYRKTTDGIMDSTAVSAVFTNPSETVSGISYMGMTELKKYVNSLMTYMKAPIELKSPATKLLSAWKSFFNKNHATDDETWTTGKIEVDTSMFADYPKLIEQIASYLETANNAQMEAFQAEMTLGGIKDLEKTAWYYEYIKSLAGKGIISGYEDGTFRPGAPITRAEYTKMVIVAAEKLKIIKDENSSFSPMFEISIGKPQYDTEKIFGDVATDSWYYPYVKQAKSNGIVNGYNATGRLGDFRPNSFITRAEAVKILFNISGRLKGIQVIAQPMDSLVHFNDVSKDDWFLTPVAAAFHYGLVKGATPQTFEPARNITRAEAAKIIKLFMDMETVKK